MSVLYKNSSGDVVSLIPEINNIDDSTIAADTTYSSEKIEGSYPITTTTTGSDLTLSTSSGNINALTVYGKSEVVSDKIISAGEGYAVVDLGSLDYSYDTTRQWFLCTDLRFLIKPTSTIGDKGNILCPIYTTYSIFDMWSTSVNNAIGVNEGATLYVRNTDYTDPAAFKSAMSGVILAYEEATPTNNAIAVKTDNGSGIDGTMAVFETGTPIRGIPDTDVRDVMQWDGSAGDVTKVCGEVDLGTLNWGYSPTSATPFFQADLSPINCKANSINMLCPLYTPQRAFWNVPNNDMKIASGGGYLNISNFAYTNSTEFQTAMSGVKLIYELATPTTQTLTTNENESIAGLRTFTPQTHAQNNAGATMTVEAYAGTANGKAVQELENRIKSEIDEVKNEKSHFCYSYKIDKNNSDPATCVKPHFDTRYGCDNFNFTSAHMDYANDRFDYGSWEGFIRRIARPCMLKFDGTVDYYLDPDDYSKKITGEASDVADVNYQGNAMVELEKLYFKRYTHNGIQYCFIADRKLDKSFKAYAHHDKYGKELDYIYRACYDGMYDGTRLRSISGVDYHNLNALTAGYIMSNATRQEEMNFAKANNVSTEQGEGWNILHKSEWDYINDILVLISMSTDTQGTFGRGRDSGYVSTTNTGIISTGTMNDKGLFWGKNDSTAGVKVLGIENHWANLFKSCAGWFSDKGTQKVKYTYGTEDGSTAEGFNTDASGYISITGATPTKGDSSTSGYGYITAWQYGEYGIIPYETISGASNKYLCDILYFNNTVTCFAVVGGDSYGGLNGGAFCSLLHCGAGYRCWDIGAALSYKPLSAT